MCKKMTTRTRTVVTLAAVAMAILGLTTTSANAGVISYVQVTNDADCGISTDNTYTHTIDFGTGTPGALINGVQFDAYNAAANGTLNFNREVSSGLLSDHAGDGNHNVSGSLVDLMTDMYYNGDNAVGGTTTWTLSGLTAGQTYSTRLYSRMWVVSARTVTIVFDPDGGGAISDSTGMINQDDATSVGFTNANDAYYISYQFTAVAGEDLVISVTQENFNQSWHIYGLTNEIAGPVTKAYGPTPKDGAQSTDTWISLSWKPGDYAVSHDVYMGDNFDDVNDGTRDSEVFQGNQPVDSLYFVAGFTGYAFPDGLVNGNTYYWRIDEVNDADPNSPWKGKVWSFWIPPKKAYDPVPSDGVKFIDSENPILSWTTGFGAKLHTVYFGDDFDTVANATGGLTQAVTNYNPGPLEVEKTYYWRVDEFVDAVNTYTGDVWSFTTAKVGGGLRADYYHWTGTYPPANAFQVFVTSEMVDEVNWNWGDPGSPNSLINDNYFGCIFTGELEAAFTETYTFYMTTDDGQRLWIDGQPVIDMWIQQGMTEHNGTIDLVAGQRYSIEAWMYEAEGGAGCEMRWSSPSTPKQIIPQAALSPPVKASSPSPSNGVTGTKMTPILRWGAGDFAASHEVYFGTDANAVKNATTASPEYIGPRALDDESYDPGKLAWATSYFWRVDEVNTVNPDSPWVGNLWSFTTGDFIVVDDFEDYDAGDNQIWYAWHDGLGYGAPGVDPYFAGNGTGAAVGDETTASYTEETIVHGGNQSMPLAYDNNKQGYAYYSEVEHALTDQRDWTEEGVTELSLWFYGDPNNSDEPLYVAVSNSAGTPAVVVHDDPAAATIDTWTEWIIPLQSFADQGIILTNVDRIAIGLGSRGNMTIPGGSGKMFFDDIRLYQPSTAP